MAMNPGESSQTVGQSHRQAGVRRNAIVTVAKEPHQSLFNNTESINEELYALRRSEATAITCASDAHLRNDHEVILRCAGTGDVESLSKAIDNTGLSWALLWSQNHGSRNKKLIAVVCNGLCTQASQSEKVLALSAEVVKLFGEVDLTLQVARGHELPYQLEAAHRTEFSSNICFQRQTPVNATEALRKIGEDLTSFNWVLLEPTKLHLHHAGSGGLEELKKNLAADKVLFGVLRFTFPRGCHAPPIIKFLFIHWIGSEVSAVRRGQWNSKLEEAAAAIRRACDFAFRKTAYTLGDLILEELIEELARVTCAASSDTRELSADWYFEGMQHPMRTASCDKPESLTTSLELCCSGAAVGAHVGSCLVLREPAKEAIAKLQSAKQGWILLSPKEPKIPSSGGA